MPAIRYRYQTIEFGDTDIHLRTLRDKQEFHDPGDVAGKLGISPANWPLFGVVWDSGHLLAHCVLDQDYAGQRILEVGCGIGLASILLQQRQADITATDYHPAAEHFLQYNAALNKTRPIPFVRADWGDAESALGLFDLIIGSDLLYEHDHAGLLAGFINRHAKPQSRVVITDPGRGNCGRFSRHMLNFGFSHMQQKSRYLDFSQKPLAGTIYRYARTVTQAA